MVRQLIAGLLMYVWNAFVDFQKPIVYTIVETNNNQTFRFNRDGFIYLLEVKQLRKKRKPRFPFRSKIVYLYEVTQYTFKDNAFVNKRSDKLPEFCIFLFRNTKIPHVLAANAFLEFNKEG